MYRLIQVYRLTSSFVFLCPGSFCLDELSIQLNIDVCLFFSQAKELSDLRKKSPSDLWKDDLEQFLTELDVSEHLFYCENSHI